MPSPDEVTAMIEGIGGKVNEIGLLPDGSGFAMASFDLPKDHWLYAEEFAVPPMPFRMGTSDPRRHEFEQKIRQAAEYAIRASTMNGKEMDFDPDALSRNFITGMLGYWTADGLSGDNWGDPSPVPPLF